MYDAPAAEARKLWVRNIKALMLTSKKCFHHSLRPFYNTVLLQSCSAFWSFASLVGAKGELGHLVRRLRVSHRRPSDVDQTKCASATECSFAAVLWMLPHMPNLCHLDVQGLSEVDSVSPPSHVINLNVTSFYNLIASRANSTLNLSHLSLRHLSGLSTSGLKDVCPRLEHVTYLNLTSTDVTIEDLQSIPVGARIIQLNLSGCKRLDAAALTKFLRQHNSVKGLEMVDVSFNHFASTDTSKLILALPKSIKKLSLKGNRIEYCYTESVGKLVQSLKELRVGQKFCIRQLARRLSTSRHASPRHRMRFLDISDHTSKASVIDMLLAKPNILCCSTAPLANVKVSRFVASELAQLGVLERIGWECKQIDAGYFLVR